MKKLFSVLAILIVCFCCFAFNIEHKVEKHDFDSDAMLEKYYEEPEKSSKKWDDVKISLITASAGSELYSWFGHTGLMVEYPNSSSMFFDYGRFAFSSAFYANFVKGVLWFSCGCFYSDYEIERFQEAKRTVSKLELNLTSEQKEAIVDFLETNTSDEHDEYLYDHFKDNCATRIRDIINRATDGDFEKWAKAQKGYTYREQTSRILHRNLPVEWVLDYVQGPSVDADATLWEEMFLPENLEKGLISYGKIAGKQSYLTDYRTTDTRPTHGEYPIPYITQSFISGIVIAILLLILYTFCPKGFVTVNSLINFILAVLGSILFYMMLFSGHSFSWNNENILFVGPILLLTFILGFKHKKNNTVLTALYGTLTATTTLIILVKMLNPQLMNQANFPQLLAVLPYYMANFAICLIEVI